MTTSLFPRPIQEQQSQIDESEVLYLRRLTGEQQFASAALQKFVDHLCQRYRLTKADAIDLNGKITRAEPT